MDLSACQLTALPDDFTLLTRLMELNLASNRLSQLPQTVGRMTRLVRLDLSDNRLSDLPLSTGHLTGLQTLMIQGNPIRNPRLLEKFSIGSDHLVDFLERRMMGTSTHLSITHLVPQPNGGRFSASPDLFLLSLCPRGNLVVGTDHTAKSTWPTIPAWICRDSRLYGPKPQCRYLLHGLCECLAPTLIQDDGHLHTGSTAIQRRRECWL
jgi:hypothetical protein